MDGKLNMIYPCNQVIHANKDFFSIWMENWIKFNKVIHATIGLQMHAGAVSAALSAASPRRDIAKSVTSGSGSVRPDSLIFLWPDLVISLRNLITKAKILSILAKVLCDQINLYFCDQIWWYLYKILCYRISSFSWPDLVVFVQNALNLQSL